MDLFWEEYLFPYLLIEILLIELIRKSLLSVSTDGNGKVYLAEYY